MANSDRGMLLFGYHVQKGPFLVWRVIMVDNLSESTTPRLNSKECHNFLGVTQNNILNLFFEILIQVINVLAVLFYHTFH